MQIEQEIDAQYLDDYQKIYSIGEEGYINLYIYSENAPTKDGSYWHYVDGVPTIW